MSSMFRDQHPTCAQCMGVKCSSDVTCDICKHWSVAQWEAFLKKCSYSGRHKSCPSGAALPPSGSASSEAGCRSPSPHSSSLLCLLGRMPGLTSRCLVDACTLVGALHDLPLPVCGLSSPGRGLQTAPQAVGFTRALGVYAHVLAENTHAALAAAGPAVIVHIHTGHCTSLVTAHGHGTGLGHRSRVRGLGGVTGIVRRLMLPPRITVTLGHGWGLPLRLGAAPSWGPSLSCVTSPGCSSVCRGHANSGMRLRALFFRLLQSPVLGWCLDLLLWNQ